MFESYKAEVCEEYSRLLRKVRDALDEQASLMPDGWAFDRLTSRTYSSILKGFLFAVSDPRTEGAFEADDETGNVYIVDDKVFYDIPPARHEMFWQEIRNKAKEWIAQAHAETVDLE